MLGVNQAHHGLNLTPRLVKEIVADGTTIDADALSDVHQVRGAVSTYPQTSRPQQRINHDRRRSLAVSTGNLDDGTGLLWVTEQVEDGSLPIQTGADAMLRPASRQLSDKLIMAAQ